MAFNNVPVNGWPQIKDLEKLDAIAQQIENMPTFTSSDKTFLEALPAFPATDGKKMLAANTSEGATTLAYEEIPVELPADPETDGTRVLTATTDNGETVKSWEPTQTGENKVFSTTPVKIGTWIDGKKVKRVVIELQSPITLINNDWTSLGVTPPSDAVKAISVVAMKNDGICYMYCEINMTSSNIAIQQYSGANKTASIFVIEYVSNET